MTPLVLVLTVLLADSPDAIAEWFVATQARLEASYPHGKLSCEVISINPAQKERYSINSLVWDGERTAWDYTVLQEISLRRPGNVAREPEPDHFRMIRRKDRLVSYVDGGVLTIATGAKAEVRCPPSICARPDEMWFRFGGPLAVQWSVHQQPARWREEKHANTATRADGVVILEHLHRASGGGLRIRADAATGCVKSYEVWNQGEKNHGEYDWDLQFGTQPILKSCRIFNGGEMSYEYTLKSIDLNYVPRESEFDSAQLPVARGALVREHSPTGLKSYTYGGPNTAPPAIPFDKLIRGVRSKGFAAPK